MSENLFHVTVTEEERVILETRTREAVSKVRGGSSVEADLCEYARENGFTEEEAYKLVREDIIAPVDEHNASCRQAAKESTREWLKDKVSGLCEGMSLEDECKCKTSLLRAIRGTDIAILRRVKEMSSDEWEEAYEDLCGSEEEQLESGGYTEDMLSRLDDALEEAIENSGIALGMSAQFEMLLDDRQDEESVKCFVYEMWQDEKYKYCAAAAACVARRNGELPSIPDGTPDRVITLGVCQGIDVDNVEKQVALGEMTADTAYRVLKIIAAVGLTLIAVGTVLCSIVAAGALSVGVATAVFGTGIIGSLVAFTLTLGLGNGLIDAACDLVKPMAGLLNSAADFTYGKLKQGAKAVYHFTADKLVPHVKEAIRRIGDFLRAMAVRVHHSAKNKQTISC